MAQSRRWAGTARRGRRNAETRAVSLHQDEVCGGSGATNAERGLLFPKKTLQSQQAESSTVVRSRAVLS